MSELLELSLEGGNCTTYVHFPPPSTVMANLSKMTGKHPKWTLRNPFFNSLSLLDLPRKVCEVFI